MLKAIIALVGLSTLPVPMLARADDERGSAEPERVEVAPRSPLPLPGPIYDEAGRLLAAPPPSDVRDARDVLLRLPALPEAAGGAGYEPGRTAPRRRGEP
jgi:hypothetical protein